MCRYFATCFHSLSRPLASWIAPWTWWNVTVCRTGTACSWACLEAGVQTLYTEDMGAPRTINGLQLINPLL